MKPDEKIWDDFRKGKSYALSHIYYQYVQELFRYGKKFSGNDELIKDTIQDLFFDLIRTRVRLGETSNIRFYLYRSFRRKLSKNIKAQNRNTENQDYEPAPEIVYSAEQEIIVKEELTHREKIVQKGLKQLSPKQREILYYRFTCGFDYDQICEIMHLKYDSARKQVSRALNVMKEILSGSDLFVFFFGIFAKKKNSQANSSN